MSKKPPNVIEWAFEKLVTGDYFFPAEAEDPETWELWIQAWESSDEDRKTSLFDLISEENPEAAKRLREEATPDDARKMLSCFLAAEDIETAIRQLPAKATKGDVMWIGAGLESSNRRKVLTQIFRRRQTLASDDELNKERTLLASDEENVAAELRAFYGRELARLFPKMVRRAGKLRVLAASESVPDEVQEYLKEATKCFIYGQYTACLIVCRAAVEFGVRDFLIRSGKRKELEALRIGKKDSLEEMIKLSRTSAARGLHQILDDANDVRRWANEAVHEKVPSQERCEEAFVKTRALLRELYSRDAN